MAELAESAGRDPQNLPVIAHATAESRFRLLFSSIGVDDPEYENEYMNAMRDAGLFCVRMLLCRLQGAGSVDAVRRSLNQSMGIRGPHAKNLSSLLFGDYVAVERRLVELNVLQEPDLSGDWRELLVSLDLNPDLAPSLRFATGLTFTKLLALSRDDPHAVEEACGDIRRRVPVFQQSADLLAVFNTALTRATADSAIQPPAPVESVFVHVEEVRVEVEVQRGGVPHPADRGMENVAEARGPVELPDVQIESTATIGTEEEDELDAHPLSEYVSVLGPSETAPMEEEQSVVLGPAPTPPQTAFSGHRDVLRGHTNGVLCLCLLPDNMMISGGADYPLRLWNPITKECVRVFQGHTGGVWYVAVLPDGRLISGSGDWTLRIWNLFTGETEKVLTGHTSWVTCVSALSENRVISGSYDKSLIVWDVATGKPLSVLQGHSGYVLCLIVLADAQVVSGDHEGQILIWDLPSQRSIRTLSGHTWGVTCLSILSSDRLASGSYDNTIRIWNYVSGECISELRGHEDYVYSLCVLSDGRLVSGGGDWSKPNGGDTKIRIWNTETGECTQTSEGHSHVVRCLLSLSDGRLALGSDDNTILLWS